MTNKVGDGHQEVLAKARVKEARDQMTIDKIGEGVKGNLKSLIGLNEASLDELRKVFDDCESGSLQELSIINNIKNNPKTTPEDLDYYFFNVKEGSEAEFLVAKALITHPNLTQEIFDKNYGMAMQKGGLVFDLFEVADQERSKKAKEEKEKMGNIMQGTVSKIDFTRGTGVIHGENGKDYLLHFSQIKGEHKAEIFSDLILESEVEFKLIPYNGKPGIGFDPNFIATDIVVKN